MKLAAQDRVTLRGIQKVLRYELGRATRDLQQHPSQPEIQADVDSYQAMVELVDKLLSEKS
jgi:hypothetical protein